MLFLQLKNVGAETKLEESSKGVTTNIVQYFWYVISRRVIGYPPAKTRTAPIHCLLERTLPKKMTEPRTVKNLRVVVMMEQGRGPNSLTHMKMKN